MTNEIIKHCITVSAFLVTSLISLGLYTYNTDKHNVTDVITKTQQNVDTLDTDLLKTKNDTLEKIYNLSLMSNEKISKLQLNAAEADGNYKELSMKVDTFIESSKQDRKILLSKLENHEQRLSNLEKTTMIHDRNIKTLAKKNNVTIFGVEWGGN